MESGSGLPGISGRDADPSAQGPAAEGKGCMCQGPNVFLPMRGKHDVWMKTGIKRGFTACAVPGLSNRHRSPELSIWYLSPALKFN